MLYSTAVQLCSCSLQEQVQRTASRQPTSSRRRQVSGGRPLADARAPSPSLSQSPRHQYAVVPHIDSTLRAMARTAQLRTSAGAGTVRPDDLAPRRLSGACPTPLPIGLSRRRGGRVHTPHSSRQPARQHEETRRPRPPARADEHGAARCNDNAGAGAPAALSLASHTLQPAPAYRFAPCAGAAASTAASTIPAVRAHAVQLVARVPS